MAAQRPLTLSNHKHRWLCLLCVALLTLAACGDDSSGSGSDDDTTDGDLTDGDATDGDTTDPIGCSSGAECDSGVCDEASGDCLAPTCSDSVSNGAETDVDCGGDCPTCPDGAACEADDDCQSGLCDAATGSCAAPAASCSDGTRNGAETDVDCGGDCLACGAGAACDADDDCASDFCDADTGLCACSGGFIDDGAGACVDVDECAAGTAGCDPNATCTNTDGGFSCACDAGFAGDGATCADTDECADGADDCDPNATCENTVGGFSCACDAGFTDDGAGGCADVDECADSADDCADGATCTNTPGGFTCGCPPGFTGDGVTCADIDECVQGTDDCDANAACTNTDGAFTCACDAGFTGDGVTCADTDECADGTAGCDANAACTNNPGGFVCACEGGFVGDGFSCVAATDCDAGPAVCGADATCTPQPGGGSICLCDPGYTGDGVTCADVNECSQGTDDCDPNAACSNTIGGFFCACDFGYTGDGVTCADTDECAAGTDDCDPNASCTNNPGGFSCACDAGFTGDGTSCADVDECVAGTDTCDANATCSNDPGAFSCVCDPGYAGDGFSCADTDECAAGTDDCDANATCTNNPGGFSCACDAGFTGDGASCADVDECVAGTDNCDANATCANDMGGFTCTCDPGYAGDGVTCADADECAAGTDTCDPLAGCTNTDGGFTCGACPAGTVDVGGDGTQCATYTSCAELLAAQPGLASGDYTIDTGASGPITAYCDMETDGGLGYTMLRIDDPSLGATQQPYRDACAAVGMELIVPRTRAHALAIRDWNGGAPPNLVGVYPMVDGAVGLENWEGQCQGVRGCRFWVSNTNNADCNGLEPSGDNDTANALALVGAGCDYGRWNDGADSAGPNTGRVICSTNDTADPAPAADCRDALEQDLVYNTVETGSITGLYAIDPDLDGAGFMAYCDQLTDDGGWTLIMRSVSSNFAYTDTAWTTADLVNQDVYDFTAAGVSKYEAFNSVPFDTIRTSDIADFSVDLRHAFDAPLASALALFTAPGFELGVTLIDHFNDRAPANAEQWGCTNHINYGFNQQDYLGLVAITTNHLCDWNGGARWGQRVNANHGNTGNHAGQGWGSYSTIGALYPYTFNQLLWVRDTSDLSFTSCLEWLGAGYTGDGVYAIDPDGPGAGVDPFAVTCDMTTDGGGWTVISDEDFEYGVFGWSNPATSAACYSTTMLGGYNVFGAGASTSKTFDLMGIPHTEARADLTYYVIDSWDNHEARVELDGAFIHNQPYTGGGAHTCGSAAYGDVGPVLVTSAAAHAADSVTLHVTSTLDQAANDESWGIDDVVVRIR